MYDAVDMIDVHSPCDKYVIMSTVRPQCSSVALFIRAVVGIFVWFDDGYMEVTMTAINNTTTTT